MINPFTHPGWYRTLRAGLWLVCKTRRQAAESGVQVAARNLRKQGVPLELALLILTEQPGAYDLPRAGAAGVFTTRSQGEQPCTASRPSTS